MAQVQTQSLIPLTYQDRQVRTIEKDGEIWWVAKDVCDILNHSNSRMVLSRLDDDEKAVSNIYTPGGMQEISVVNEVGLYSLILSSRLPEAKEFKRWVTHQVLPQIRKTGSYNTKIEDYTLRMIESRCERVTELYLKARQQLSLRELTEMFGRMRTSDFTKRLCRIRELSHVLSSHELSKLFDLDPHKLKRIILLDREAHGDFSDFHQAQNGFDLLYKTQGRFIASKNTEPNTIEDFELFPGPARPMAPGKGNFNLPLGAEKKGQN